MTCLNCNKGLTNLRAKYCSDRCRMAYTRRTDNPNKEQPEHEQLLPEQDVPEQKVFNCPNCNREMRREDGYGGKIHLVDNCYDCVASKSKLPRNKWPLHQDQKK